MIKVNGSSGYDYNNSRLKIKNIAFEHYKIENIAIIDGVENFKIAASWRIILNQRILRNKNHSKSEKISTNEEIQYINIQLIIQ